MYVPEERNIYTRDQLLHMVCTALGGRAAEEVVFGRISTGAVDDLDKVTKIAYSQLLRLGMSENMGPASFGLLQADGCVFFFFFFFFFALLIPLVQLHRKAVLRLDFAKNRRRGEKVYHGCL